MDILVILIFYQERENMYAFESRLWVETFCGEDYCSSLRALSLLIAIFVDFPEMKVMWFLVT